MKDKKVIKGILLALGLTCLNPMLVSAKEGNIDWKSIFKTVVDEAEKIDEKINKKIVDPVKDKLGDIDVYKHDSLWLITDIPNTDPSEERHYFFVDKNTPTIKSSTYYDKNGNKVSRNDAKAVKRIDKELYPSVSDSSETFLIMTEYDLKTLEFSINYVDLSLDYLWEEEKDVSFGRFTNLDEIIPSDMQKEKYNTKELIAITDVLNDPEYVLEGSTITLIK